MIRLGQGFALSRRGLLRLGVAMGMGTPFRFGHAAADPLPAKDDSASVDAIEQMAIAVGLGPFRRATSEHFQAIGDAPDRFQKEVLGFCEKLSRAFLTYFNGNGFAVAYPEMKMSVVVLKDRKSYAAWIGDPAEKAVAGHYDIDKNRLVIFDSFDELKGLGNRAAKVNSFTLAHETNHLLGFNTGLLNRAGDIPTSISEGLATYGELYQKAAPTIGGKNSPRIAELVEAGRLGQPWIELESLLKEDKICLDPETNQLAYAESWLFISMMMKDPEKREKLRTYLDRLQRPHDPADRIRHAKDALGPLDKLNRELRVYAQRMIRR